MNKPFFSIVIPTRNRPETLPFAIKTALIQGFDDFEIIVADNSSDNKTKEVIDNLASKKVIYTKPDKELAMSDNWEFALSQTKGKYILLFGDDDGILPNTLQILYQLIQHTKAKVIRWARVYYLWANCKPEIFANNLSLPTINESKWLDSNKIISNILKGNIGYDMLPMFYNAVADRDIIISMIKETKRFFHSITPDVFSGYVLAYISGKYLSIGIPLSINGGSSKSNGMAGLYKSKNKITNDFVRLNNQSSLGYHKKFPYIRSLHSYIVEPFLQLKEALDIKDIEVDYQIIYQGILNNLMIYDEEEKEIFIKELKRCAELHETSISELIYDYINRIKIIEDSPVKQPKGFTKNSLNIDASDFDIENVYDVAMFASNFFNYSSDDLIENIQPLEEDKEEETKQKLSFYRRLRTAARVIIKGY